MLSSSSGFFASEHRGGASEDSMGGGCSEPWQTVLWQTKKRGGAYLLQPSPRLAGKPPPRQQNHRKALRADFLARGGGRGLHCRDKGEEKKNSDEGDHMEFATWILKSDCGTDSPAEGAQRLLRPPRQKVKRSTAPRARPRTSRCELHLLQLKWRGTTSRSGREMFHRILHLTFEPTDPWRSPAYCPKVLVWRKSFC
ncbi:hypothetical protein CRENBAI_009371 [Crenichthys baileyi]|uniref:Uncharacterized protein n=1 Tax=Crenichthys baileyi TaxID=28760 RepID=A0AAV9QWW2_9TELE